MLKFNLLLVMFFNCIYAYQSDIKYVNGFGIKDTSKLIGVVKNQSWVTSKILTEKELKKLIIKYKSFEIIKYDSLYGMLIKYNNLDTKSMENLEKLKQEPGVYKIFNKVYEGKNAFKINGL